MMGICQVQMKKKCICVKKDTKKKNEWTLLLKRKKVVWKEKMWNKHLGLRETSWDGE